MNSKRKKITNQPSSKRALFIFFLPLLVGSYYCLFTISRIEPILEISLDSIFDDSTGTSIVSDVNSDDQPQLIQPPSSSLPDNKQIDGSPPLGAALYSNDEEVKNEKSLLSSTSLQSVPSRINPFRDIQLSPNHHRQQQHQHHQQEESGPPPPSPPYSSSTCISAVNQEMFLIAKTRFVSRTCHFRNLYYTPHDQKFHYYPSPEESELFQNNQYYNEFQRRITTSIGNIYQRDANDVDKIPSFSKWHPEVHRGNGKGDADDGPPKDYAIITKPSKLVFLLYHPFYSFKIGHLVWDDMLSLFSMLDNFGMAMVDNNDDDEEDTFHLPFYVETGNENDPYFRCIATTTDGNLKKRWPECTKTFHKFFPELLRYETHKTGDIIRTGNWLRGMENVYGGANVDVDMDMKVQESNQNISSEGIKNIAIDAEEKDWNKMLPNTTHVLIPTVLSGTGRLGQMSCNGDCAINRASQLWSFRNYLLRNIFWPNYKSIQVEQKKKAKQRQQQQSVGGYITFSLPGGTTRPEQVSNFENIVPIAKELFGNDKVKVVDMAKLTLQEEALLVMDTAILFANHGSGSLSSIFCERGSAIFLYASGECTGHPNTVWCDHGRNHFDSVFYESAGYIRTQWIEKEDRNNTAKIKNLLQLEMRKTLDAWSI